jgi:subtilase family serine protease
MTRGWTNKAIHRLPQAAPLVILFTLGVRMNYSRPCLTIAALIGLAACSGGQTGSSLPAQSGEMGQPLTQSSALSTEAILPQGNFIRSCTSLLPVGYASCDALRRTDVTGDMAKVRGFHPAAILSAYNIPKTGGSGETIGIVDAFDDPNAEADLGVYRAQFKLSACTTANGCFQKANELGQAGPYPPGDASWGSEISLDLDMASAVCPACHIVLVEADDNYLNNLGRSVVTAVAKGANVVSNSYSGTDNKATDKHYDQPGHVIVAASGDNAFGATFPGSLASVVSVGGTSLFKSSNPRGWIEWTWSYSGSGCSAIVPKPAWQHDTGCTMRTQNDISAVANPNTGVAIYDTYGLGGSWFVYGGTSVATPIIASMFALAGDTASQHAAKHIWAARGKHMYDITQGSNGTCSPAYLCTAGPGYDGPTGWGTPNGLTIFQ